MKQKTIVAVWGTANVGKSMTLASFGHQLQAKGAVTAANLTSSDYRGIFNYRNTSIGLQTFGDYVSAVRDGLAHFLQQKCEIILIASKSYGETVDYIGQFAHQNGYRIIWAAPYEVRDGSIPTAAIKDKAASHLLLLVDDVMSGIL